MRHSSIKPLYGETIWEARERFRKRDAQRVKLLWCASILGAVILAAVYLG